MLLRWDNDSSLQLAQQRPPAFRLAFRDQYIFVYSDLLVFSATNPVLSLNKGEHIRRIHFPRLLAGTGSGLVRSFTLSDTRRIYLIASVTGQRLPESTQACHLLSPWFFLSLFIKREDGGDIFLRNGDWILMHYTALYIRSYNTSYFYYVQNIRLYKISYIWTKEG
jgi:hypothetical protein